MYSQEQELSTVAEKSFFFFIYPEVAATVVGRGRNRYNGREYSGRVIVHFLWLPEGTSGELQGHVTLRTVQNPP